jgi:hypothetical protein
VNEAPQPDAGASNAEDGASAAARASASSLPDQSLKSAEWFGAALLLAGTVALLGLSARAGRSASDAPPAARAVEIPAAIEPIGAMDEPPTRFVWTPGGDDVELSQLILYGRDMKRIWETGPLDTCVATVPLVAYSGIRAGETCFWRVREVANGKARAASNMQPFAFRRDLAGNVAEPEHPSLRR